MKTHAAELRVQTICLVVLAVLAIAYALFLFSNVLIPFVLAVLLLYCLTPVIDVQMNWLHLPRPVAIVTTMLLGGIILFLFAILITAAVGQVSAHANEYQQQVEDFIESLPLERLGADEMLAGKTAALFTSTVSGIMSILSNGTLVLIFLIFMLAGQGMEPAETGSIRHEIETRTKRFLLTVLFMSIVTGLLVGSTMAILDVRYAWMFGFLAFLLNFIPSIGSVIATLMPLPVVILSPELSLASQILAIAIPAVIQFAAGNLIQPKIMGTSLDLHPVAIILSLIFFGLIWGIVGMFLATPITSIVKITLERFEYTRPAAEVFAGRLGGLSRLFNVTDATEGTDPP